MSNSHTPIPATTAFPNRDPGWCALDWLRAYSPTAPKAPVPTTRQPKQSWRWINCVWVVSLGWVSLVVIRGRRGILWSFSSPFSHRRAWVFHLFLRLQIRDPNSKGKKGMPSVWWILTAFRSRICRYFKKKFQKKKGMKLLIKVNVILSFFLALGSTPLDSLTFF